MKRRKFINIAATGIIVLPAFSRNMHSLISEKFSIRLGGPVFEKYNSPDEWMAVLKKEGYRAAYCPVKTTDDETTIRAYRKTAEQNDIVIAEVGAWSNPISPVEATAKNAIEKCIDSLALADHIGARCCVNISGSRHPENWAGPHPDNLTPATFDLIVETTRKIIDAVKPTNSYYTLEAMPWSYPDSAESYLKLMKAIDRDRFAVHLDPANWVNCPQVYFKNSEMIRNAFKKLGPYIKSCHAKDIAIDEKISVTQFSEVRPGLGKLDYKVFLSELSKLDDVPLMMEHLPSAEEYSLAARYILGVEYY